MSAPLVVQAEPQHIGIFRAKAHIFVAAPAPVR
jgi:hypothetical protein